MRHLLFEISGFISGCSGFSWGVPGFSWGVPGFLGGVLGFLGGVPGFLGVFRVFLGVFRVFGGCSWFFGCSGMFRDVPVFRVPLFRCSWKYYMPRVVYPLLFDQNQRCFLLIKSMEQMCSFTSLAKISVHKICNINPAKVLTIEKEFSSHRIADCGLKCSLLIGSD